MIDRNGTVILIYLDRMVKKLTDNQEKQSISSVIWSEYFAPEVQRKEPYSYEADVYSIGKLIYFLFTNELMTKQFSDLRKIYEKCVQYNPEERFNIEELIDCFYFSCFSNVWKKMKENDTMILISHFITWIFLQIKIFHNL